MDEDDGIPQKLADLVFRDDEEEDVDGEIIVQGEGGEAAGEGGKETPKRKGERKARPILALPKSPNEPLSPCFPSTETVIKCPRSKSVLPSSANEGGGGERISTFHSSCSPSSALALASTNKKEEELAGTSPVAKSEEPEARKGTLDDEERLRLRAELRWIKDAIKARLKILKEQCELQQQQQQQHYLANCESGHLSVIDNHMI